MKYLKSTIYLSLILFFVALVSPNAQAQTKAEHGSKAIGVMIGEPTGISFKYWNSSSRAFDLGLAWSFRQSDAMSLHGDYLWHSWLGVDEGKMAFHYGIGARAYFTEAESGVGARIPLGLSYLFDEAPIELFFEIAPVIDVIPATDADGSGGIGARFYF